MIRAAAGGLVRKVFIVAVLRVYVHAKRFAKCLGKKKTIFRRAFERVYTLRITIRRVVAKTNKKKKIE